MDMKKMLNLTVEVMKSNGIKWDSLKEDEQLRIIMKLPEMRSELMSTIKDVLVESASKEEAMDVSEERIVHTQNGDITITTF